MTECEGGQCVPGGDGPGNWTFNDREGHGVWPGSGAIANLTVERFDAGGVVIRRHDISGRTPGFVAIYTGKIYGNRIEGDVTWSWPGVWSKSPVGKWYATFDAPTTAALSDQPKQSNSAVASAQGSQTDRSVSSAKQPNVSGPWQITMLAADGRSQVVRMRIDQTADKIKITLENNNSPKDGVIWFEGRFVSNSVIAGKGLAQDSTPQNPHWLPGRFIVESPDRLRAEKEGAVLERAAVTANTANQNHGPTASVRNPGAALLLALLATGSDDGDILDRISYLEGAEANAHAECIGQDSNSDACYNDRRLKDQLADAHAELKLEIHDLIEAQQKLSPECKAGNQESCEKLEQVGTRLKKDQLFTIDHFFR